jgi:hypothetical protein
VTLGWKAAIVFVLMVLVGALTIWARRRNYDAVRRQYTTRRSRVVVKQEDGARAREAEE